MNDVSLKEHIDQRFEDFDRRLRDTREADDKRVQIALTAAKEAVDKAEQANERRLGLLNEFRAQQADEARKYAQQLIVDKEFENVAGRLGRMENLIATLQGRSLALAGFGAILGGIATAVVMRFLV